MTMRSWLFPLVLTLTLSACASTTQVQTTTALDASAGWALAPLSNHSETPLAGERAQGTLLTLLHHHGVTPLREVPRSGPVNPLALDNGADRQAALGWAQQQELSYVVTGAIDEWHYKTGLDGEPAVGISLQVRDANTGELLWSASGSRGGWGFTTLSGVSSDLLAELVDALPLSR